MVDLRRVLNDSFVSQPEPEQPVWPIYILNWLNYSFVLYTLFYFIYLNTCWAPNIEMSPKRFTMATIARYFLLPSRPTGLHSHLTVNEWLHVVYTARFEYPPKWLQHCFVVTQLVWRETADVSVHVPCTPYNHAPVYSVIFCEATHAGCMCV